MKKQLFTSLVALMLALALGLTLGGCKKNKKIKKTETQTQKITAEDTVDGEQTHESDPDFFKDVTEVKPDATDSTGTGSTEAGANGEKTESQSGTSGTTSSAGKPATGTTVAKDSYVVFPVMIEKNTGTCVASVVLNYDTKVFTYVDYVGGDVFDGHSVSADKGVVRILFETDSDDSGYPTDTKKNGKLINLKFKVNADAPAGTYTLTVKESMFANVEEQLIKPSISVGKITVK